MPKRRARVDGRTALGATLREGWGWALRVGVILPSISGLVLLSAFFLRSVGCKGQQESRLIDRFEETREEVRVGLKELASAPEPEVDAILSRLRRVILGHDSVVLSFLGDSTIPPKARARAIPLVPRSWRPGDVDACVHIIRHLFSLDLDANGKLAIVEAIVPLCPSAVYDASVLSAMLTAVSDVVLHGEDYDAMRVQSASDRVFYRLQAEEQLIKSLLSASGAPGSAEFSVRGLAAVRGWSISEQDAAEVESSISRHSSRQTNRVRASLDRAVRILLTIPRASSAADR